jgi:hypothetical protein
LIVSQSQRTTKLLGVSASDRILLNGHCQYGLITRSRVFHLKAGQTNLGHYHRKPHDTIFGDGQAARITTRKKTGELIGTEEVVGPCVVKMPAEVVHDIEAITDLTWFCVWPEGTSLADVDG